MVALLLQPVTGPRSLMVRYQVVSELLSRWGIAHTILRSIEGPPLAQLLGMLALGDYVSYYLAILNNIDPSPTPAISSAKERLSDLSEVPV
jgi:glucose/mannose-6-phosphate isomerase